MRQLVSGAGTPVYRSSALTDTVTYRHTVSFCCCESSFDVITHNHTKVEPHSCRDS
jgi:hypothetical protein